MFKGQKRICFNTYMYNDFSRETSQINKILRVNLKGCTGHIWPTGRMLWMPGLNKRMDVWTTPKPLGVSLYITSLNYNLHHRICYLDSVHVTLTKSSTFEETTNHSLKRHKQYISRNNR